MSTTIQVPVETLQANAAVLAESTKRLEKAASAQQTFAASVPAIVDRMIKAGGLSADKRDTAIKELIEGGLTKSAEVIDHLVGHLLQKNASQMGRPADYEKAASGRSSLAASDQAFLERLDLM